MSKETAVMVLGAVAALIPLTGFPEWWRALFIFACGAAIAVLGFLLRGKVVVQRTGSHAHHNRSFVENNGARTAPSSLPDYERVQMTEKIQ